MAPVALQGAQQFRQRLVCSTLSRKPLRIDNIRSKDQNPGINEAEASLLRLVEKICDSCVVEINETGTSLRYRPGVVVGGSALVHECGGGRSIGWFLEPLILLALFGKKPLSITLHGITNDDIDPCIDTFRTATLPQLRHFGVDTEGLELKVIKRGAPPLGGGEVYLRCPVIRELKALQLLDEGMVKRIRGVAYSTRVSPKMSNRMVDAARGVLNRLLPDVYIFTDHAGGVASGNSPGYGLSLVAETTTGMLVSADGAVDPTLDPGSDAMLPEEIGKRVAERLLNEIGMGGCVDSSHQGMFILLAAFTPEDVSKFRIGSLTPQAIRTLRLLYEFLGVRFDIRPEPATGTVELVCMGTGYKNVAKKIA
eukprot:jgi/Mesvir1/16492/Mv10046-RA.1